MTPLPDGHSTGPRLVALEVAADPAAWRAAGFDVADGASAFDLGGVQIRCTGGDEDPRRGVVSWTLSGIDPEIVSLDGLPTTVVEPQRQAQAEAQGQPAAGAAPSGSAGTAGSHRVHPNGATGLDHVVVATPDLDRTLEALGAAGFDLRRIRDTTSYGAPMRQAFFRLGTTILEVVSGDVGTGQPATDAPATWFGLAVDVADLDQTAAWLGDGLGSIKGAVQAGRRIATLRHKGLGLSVAVAAMDHHADR